MKQIADSLRPPEDVGTQFHQRDPGQGRHQRYFPMSYPATDPLGNRRLRHPALFNQPGLCLPVFLHPGFKLCTHGKGL